MTVRSGTQNPLESRSWFLGNRPLSYDLVALTPALLEPAPVELHIRRADDLIVLTAKLHNLSLTGAAAVRRIAPVDRNHPAYLAIYHQPQAFAEEAFVDVSMSEVPSPLPGDALPAALRAGGRSRLVFSFPHGVKDWDGSFAGLLDAMAKWPLSRVPLKPLAPFIFAGLRETFLANLANASRAVPFLRNNPDISATVGRTVRRAAQNAAALTAEDARIAALGVGQAVQKLLANQRVRKAELEQVQHAAELQLATALAERFAHTDNIGDLISVVPGLFALFKPRQPAVDQTAIELPYRLLVSPLEEDAAFSHSVVPVVRGEKSKRVELWHSRLGSRSGSKQVDATENSVALAAIWSPDFPTPSTTEPPFKTSLSGADRADLVRLTADETGVLPVSGKPYHPAPAYADRLMLTALGGWLNVEGAWTTRPVGPNGLPVSLAKWSHHAAMARDYSVEVLRVGMLMPLGHRASVLKITERRFQPGPDDRRIAVLRQRWRIIPLEPIKQYPLPAQPFAGREFPFTTVEILTKETPNLAEPVPPDDFWPRIVTDAASGAQEDFRFALMAFDLGGNRVRFDLPLHFVAESVQSAGAASQYNGSDQGVAGRTVAPLQMQLAQLAPGPGPVTFPIVELRFGVHNVDGWKGGPKPRFYPMVGMVQLQSTEIAQMTGGMGLGRFHYPDHYVSNGFGGGNPGELFLSAIDTSLVADLGGGGRSDRSGGFVQPSFGVMGLSRAFGHVGGATPGDSATFAGGSFQPDKWFPSAKIFGGIDLKDLLVPLVMSQASHIPKLKTTRTKEQVETSFEHHVDSLPDKVLILKMNQRGKSTLDIKAATISYLQVAKPKSAQDQLGSGPGSYARDAGLKDPEAFVDAKLTWFKFDFFGAIIVSFDAFGFKVGTAKGVEPDPKLAATDPVMFGGPLAFLETLRRSAFGGSSSGGAGGGGGGGAGGGGGSSTSGFGFKPIVKVALTGLTVGGKLGVPSVVLGVFTLKNIMASAAITLPFDGRPLYFKFGFAERQNPFQLTVSLFGGGGFVMLGMTAKGVQEIEAALEFGAFAEINFGIASGGVYVKAGLYYHWNEPDRLTVFKGYVEMGGEVQALGLISVSIILNLSLGYYKQGTTSVVKGQAVLTVEVDIAFFSVSASVTVERSFAGSESDPRFIDFVPTPAIWQSYADAFA